jgi:hypothetical protein
MSELARISIEITKDLKSKFSSRLKAMNISQKEFILDKIIENLNDYRLLNYNQMLEVIKMTKPNLTQWTVIRAEVQSKDYYFTLMDGLLVSFEAKNLNQVQNLINQYNTNDLSDTIVRKNWNEYNGFFLIDTRQYIISDNLGV